MPVAPPLLTAISKETHGDPGVGAGTGSNRRLVIHRARIATWCSATTPGHCACHRWGGAGRPRDPRARALCHVANPSEKASRRPLIIGCPIVSIRPRSSAVPRDRAAVLSRGDVGVMIPARLGRLWRRPGHVVGRSAALCPGAAREWWDAPGRRPSTSFRLGLAAAAARFLLVLACSSTKKGKKKRAPHCSSPVAAPRVRGPPPRCSPLGRRAVGRYRAVDRAQLMMSFLVHAW